MPSTLASRIASARRYAKLSQQALADRVGVSRPAVSQWENDDPAKGTSPARENLVAIARVTGAPLEWLMNDDADVEPNWLVPQDWEEEPSDEARAARVRDHMDALGRRQEAAYRVRKRTAASIADTVPADEAREILKGWDPGRPDERPQSAEALVRFALAVQRDFVFIPLLDVRVSAGPGRDDMSPDVLSWYAFRREWLLESMRMDPEHSGLVIARGDSGGDDIRDGDLLLVDFRVTGVREPGTYVLAVEGEYIVKQAQRNWDGSITISSANPAYAASVVPPSRVGELTVVGLVRSQQRRR